MRRGCSVHAGKIFRRHAAELIPCLEGSVKPSVRCENASNESATTGLSRAWRSAREKLIDAEVVRARRETRDRPIKERSVADDLVFVWVTRAQRKDPSLQT